MLRLTLNSSIQKTALSKHKKLLLEAKKRLEKDPKHEFELLPFQDISNLKNDLKPYIKKFSDVAIVGIGGSILGTEVLYHTLFKHNTGFPHFHFIDSIEPTFIEAFGEKLSNKKKTLFIFASKSGDTLEILSLYKLITSGAPKWFGKSWKDHIMVITENQKGFLYKEAVKNKFKLFELPKNVGGRFSVLTNIGLVPATLMNIDTESLLKGAAKSANSLKKSFKNSLPARLASLMYEMYRKKNKDVFFFFAYADCLKYFNRWVIQLISESLGKNSKTGPLPATAVGPKDQHSMLQLMLDGPKNKFITFLEIDKNHKDFKIGNINFSQILQAEKKGTEHAMTKKKVPNITISVDQLDEENIGELLFVYEEAIALLGYMLGINPFDQPAVELGKKATMEILNKMK